MCLRRGLYPDQGKVGLVSIFHLSVFARPWPESTTPMRCITVCWRAHDVCWSQSSSASCFKAVVLLPALRFDWPIKLIVKVSVKKAVTFVCREFNHNGRVKPSSNPSVHFLFVGCMVQIRVKSHPQSNKFRCPMLRGLDQVITHLHVGLWQGATLALLPLTWYNVTKVAHHIRHHIRHGRTSQSGKAEQTHTCEALHRTWSRFSVGCSLTLTSDGAFHFRSTQNMSEN